MSRLIAIRDDDVSAASEALANGGLNSPAKEKATNRGAYGCRSPLLLRRARQLLAVTKLKVILFICGFCVVLLFTSSIISFMGWNLDYSSSVSSPSRYLFLFSVFLFLLKLPYPICLIFLSIYAFVLLAYLSWKYDSFSVAVNETNFQRWLHGTDQHLETEFSSQAIGSSLCIL